MACKLSVQAAAAVWAAPPCTPKRRRASQVVRASSKDDAGGDDAPPAANRLAMIVRRKQAEIGAQLKELGEEGLEQRLQSATEAPARPAHRLAQLIADTIPTGRPVLVLEVARGPSAESAEELGQLAAALLAVGADALAVKTDSDETPEPLKDLMAVSQAANAAASTGQRARVGAAGAPPPVLQRDWFLHPVQVVEAKEAGAAGVIGTVASIQGRGTPLMSSFAAAIGLDAPVEIVNMQELRALEQFQVPFYGLNLSVSLSISLQGFGLQVAEGLLGELPFGSLSIVGARSVEEARRARLAGADSILVKVELVRQYAPDRLGQLMEELRSATDLDD